MGELDDLEDLSRLPDEDIGLRKIPGRKTGDQRREVCAKGHVMDEANTMVKHRKGRLGKVYTFHVCRACKYADQNARRRATSATNRPPYLTKEQLSLALEKGGLVVQKSENNHVNVGRRPEDLLVELIMKQRRK
jgi:hypothetical protein